MAKQKPPSPPPQKQIKHAPKNAPKQSRPGKNAKSGDGDDAWQRVTAQTRPLDAAERDNKRDNRRGGDGAQKPIRKSRDVKFGAKSIAKSSGASKNTDQTVGPPADALSQNTDPTRPKQFKDKPPPRAEIDPKARRRLGRGRLELGGTLDMHGMTLAEAEAALRGFVAYHRAQGHAWVLVITGKGVRGEGRLRNALPDWLKSAPLSQAVAEFDQAAISHGGGGAFYLRLRRLPKAPTQTDSEAGIKPDTKPDTKPGTRRR